MAQGTPFKDSEQLLNMIGMHAQYLLYSAFAVLTMWLRLLQFFAKSKALVRLLMQTFAITVNNIAINISYVFVILWGFAAFAMTTFGGFSEAFADRLTALRTCGDMFLDKTDAVDNVFYDEVPTKALVFFLLMILFYFLFMILFFFPFMIFFIFVFFIYVQMFNAIVNYAYNCVSEGMNPQAGRKRKELRRRTGIKPTMRRRANIHCKDKAVKDKPNGTMTEADLTEKIITPIGNFSHYVKVTQD